MLNNVVGEALKLNLPNTRRLKGKGYLDIIG